MMRRSSATNNDGLPFSSTPSYEPRNKGFVSESSGGYRTPVQQSYKLSKGKPTPSKKPSFPASLPWIIVAFVSLLCLVICVTYQTRLYISHSHLQSAQSESLVQHKKFTEMERAFNTLQNKKMSYQDPEFASKRDEAVQVKMEKLHNYIKKESHREIMDRFGPGPHRIEFEVLLPTQTTDTKEYEELPSKFIVEMAPLNIMPHSIHLFLEQVHHKLWNGCSFVINAPHILQIGPHSPNGLGDKVQPFKDAELDSVAFQEYSSDYSHEKYTLGFAGRPGGPDFYINLSDNTATHGPWGQLQHVLGEEADPCFGRVVEGFEVIDRIGELPVIGDYWVLEKRVLIRNAKILEDYV